MGNQYSITHNLNQRIYSPPVFNRGVFNNYFHSDQYTVQSLFLLDTCKNKIHTIIITPKVTTDNYIIYSHGSASDMSYLIDFLSKMALRLQCIVVSFDYPGYGLSTGKASEIHCYNSLKTVIDYIVDIKGCQHNILLIGRSLGTGVVVDYVSQYDWKNPVILISPYKSMLEIGYDMIGIDKAHIKMSCSYALHNYNQFCSIDKISQAHCPIKIYHGYDDELIPISHAQQLYQQMANKSLPPTYLCDTDHINILCKN